LKRSPPWPAAPGRAPRTDREPSTEPGQLPSGTSARALSLSPEHSRVIDALERFSDPAPLTKVVDSAAAPGEGVVVDDAVSGGTEARIERLERLDSRLVHVTVEPENRQTRDRGAGKSVLEPAFQKHD